MMMMMGDNNNNLIDDNNNNLVSAWGQTASGSNVMTRLPGSNVNFDDPKIANLPRVLLMGPRRSGKTSIQVKRPPHSPCCFGKRCVVDTHVHVPLSHLLSATQRVVFNKISPHETLFRLEPTPGLERAVVDHTPLCRFTIWDFPGDDYGEDGDASSIFGNPHASMTSMIFVMDAQDEPYDHVLQSFISAVTRALEVNPNISIEVFINKVDGELFLSDESKYDCRRDIMTQVTEELTDVGVSPDGIQIRYHLTSIYDHSIYEALSRVVQRLIPTLATLENLLNVLVSTCSMEKAYLFDVVSKLYICTDSGPVDMQSVELCSDMIDVVLDVSGIYGLAPPGTSNRNAHLQDSATDNNNTNRLAPSEENGSGDTAGASTTNNNNTSGLSTALAAAGGGSQSHLGGEEEELGTLARTQAPDEMEPEIVDPDSAYDNESASVIRLSNGMVRGFGGYQIVDFFFLTSSQLSVVLMTGAVSQRSRYHVGTGVYYSF